MASGQATSVEQASAGFSVSAFGTMKKNKPGWMLPLPKEDRGRGFLPVKTRGPLRESDAEHELDFDTLRPEPFAEALADATRAGGESVGAMRERLEEAGLHPDHVNDMLKAGGEIAVSLVTQDSKLQAWAEYPETLEGRVAIHNARGRRPGTLTPQQWVALLQAWAGRCAYCGTEPATPTIEHVNPVSLGGLTELGNVVPSCGPCNRLKRSKTAEAWLGDGYLVFKARFDAANEQARAACEVTP